MKRAALWAAALLVPACGGGGGGGAPAAPSAPATADGAAFLAPLAPVDTSSPQHVIDTSQSAAQITAALQAALNAGGIIVFDNVGPITIVLSAELALPAFLTALIDGKGSVTLSGGDVRRILQKGYQSTLTVQRLRFIDARATDNGAALNVENWDGRLTVIDCEFDDCRTTSTGPDIGGGAIRATGQRHLQISGCSFTGCQGSNGGAVNSLGCQLTIIDSTFDACSAFGSGGGADVGPLGQGGIGGAVYVDGVSQNADAPLLRLSNCAFTNNVANDHAGAVFGYTIAGTGTSTIVDACAFTGNQVAGGGAHSGAFYSQNGTRVFTDSTFEGNSSPGVAGAVFVTGAGAVDFANCTLQGNQAGGLGGALFLSGGTNTLTNVTLSGNHSALFAGGIMRGGGVAVTLRNTLLQNNTATDPFNGWNVNGTMSDGGGNLQWPGPGGLTNVPAVAGILFADAQLSAPAANGGLTRTMALPMGSPALGAGVSTGAPAFDQRGQARGAPPDVGAYERP